MTSTTIKDLHDAFVSGEKKPSEVTSEYLDNIASLDIKIKAYTSVFADTAMQSAMQADQIFAKKQKSHALTGVPLSIKDVILIEGTHTTASSKMLEHYTAVYDATVITKLKSLGAVFLGKTNLDEFAMGSSTENSAFGPTHNPHDMERVPGGSSGGSAASVAANMAVASLGSDTGGSIRQPAALTGVVGLKPTYGRVSRFGLMAMASSLDQIGPFAGSVYDAGIILDAIEGRDPNDATSADISSHKLNFGEIEKADIAGMKIGIPREYHTTEGVSPEVVTALRQVQDQLVEMGAILQEISLPYTKYAIPTYYVLMPAEVSSNLARFDGIRYGLSELATSKDLQEMYLKARTAGFGDESKRRIMLGTYVLSSGYYDAYYGKAKNVQKLIKQDFENAFNEIDVILTPTTPQPAFKLGEKNDDPISMYLEDIFTVAVNIAGIPAISIPVPDRAGQLPIGFQLMGKHFDEQSILHLGHQYEMRYRK
jgi:aspartyl-tRNA(Asn)/glutamyl-tRNA(Gln) amidotransferase subunit A